MTSTEPSLADELRVYAEAQQRLTAEMRELIASLPRTPQGVLWLTDSDEPCLVHLLDGSVRLYISVEHAFAWESEAVFERWLENVTRQSVSP